MRLIEKMEAGVDPKELLSDLEGEDRQICGQLVALRSDSNVYRSLYLLRTDAGLKAFLDVSKRQEAYIKQMISAQAAIKNLFKTKMMKDMVLPEDLFFIINWLDELLGDIVPMQLLN